MITIYEISDPITGVPRYIGQTNNLTARKAVHIRSSKVTNKGNWRLSSFIKNLLNKELRPCFTAIDHIEDDQADRAEVYWIEQYRAWGFELFNIDSGGKSRQTNRKRGPEHHNYGKTHPNLAASWKKVRDKRRKPVEQLTLEGKVVKVHESMTAAKSALKITSFLLIKNVCDNKSKYKTAYGYKWRYAV